MRLLFVTTSYPSRKNPSSGIFIHLLAKSLKNIGHDIKVITPADDEKYGVEIFDSIEVYRVWYAPKYLRILAQKPGGIPASIKLKPYLLAVIPFLILFMAIKIAKMRKHCDVIHNHWIISGVISRISSFKKLNSPNLLTLRGRGIESIINIFIGKSILKNVLKNSCAVTTVSDDLARKVKKVLYDYNIYLPVYTVTNGVDEKFFTLKYPDITHPVRFIYIGSLIPGKRVDVLIKSCKIALDNGASFHLTIVGDGMEKKRIINIIEREKLKDYIQIIPFVEPKCIPDMMENFHCLVLFSSAEGKPNVVIEAMAASRAILATDLPGIIELIGESRCGYTASVDNIHEISNIILECCKRPDMLREMGKRARARIQQLGLSWERTARNYEEIYQRMIQ